MHHVNDTVVQYNHMNWTSKIARTVYCSTDMPKTMQDHVDCYIINHL